MRSYLCLGLKARNHGFIKSRVAHLEQNQYNNAEADRDTALHEPDHLRSLQRRDGAAPAPRGGLHDGVAHGSPWALLAQQQRILAALRSAAADAPLASVRAAEASAALPVPRVRARRVAFCSPSA